MGFRWTNVRFEQDIIIIDRAITLDYEFDQFGSKISRSTVVDSTKTYTSNRALKVPKVVMLALADWRKYLEARSIEINRPLVTEAFPSKFWRMRTYNGFLSTYRNFIHSNCPPGFDYPLHSYRHTFATMLLETGVNPKVVQKLLGHSNIKTTLGTYSHIQKEVVEGISGLLGNIHTQMADGSYMPVIPESEVNEIIMTELNGYLD